jgi:DENN (AEX-3) domain/ENTH domain
VTGDGKSVDRILSTETVVQFQWLLLPDSSLSSILTSMSTYKYSSHDTFLNAFLLSVYRSIEAISSQQAAVSPDKVPHQGNPQQWFLHQLSRYHQHLAQVYASTSEKGKPIMAGIPGLEFGEEYNNLYKTVDISRFILPASLLQSSSDGVRSLQASGGSILPILRCVGVAHSVRILAALLSERRVIFVSSSPTRLAVCSHAAVSMLAVGLLHWQHLYIPVLPPHLWQYLAAPYPYLIGILTITVPRLDRTDGLGEVLIIHLDTNQMETRGMESHSILERLPDLFRIGIEQVQQQLPSQAASSASELLAQELFEVLKQDKKILYGESTFDKVGETAVKTAKAVKKTLFKLRDKGRQYLQQRGSQNERDESNIGESEPPAEEPVEVNSMASDYIYTEGCHNEVAEQEVRISFSSFFLCMLGDMRWYLSTPPADPRIAGSQPLPFLDRNKFLQQKRAMGDGEGTPMWPLLNNFCQTQMLEEFAMARIEEIRVRAPVTADTPLFLQCAAYCRQHNIDFGLVNIRRITRQLAENSPTRLTGMLQTNARKTAMAITSNKAYEVEQSETIAQLVEQCRECSSVLFDVMSVIWLRLRDSRGMQWKHAYLALLLLRNLLYHGPLAAIAEATDGLAKIRVMNFYENMRSQSVQQVRTAAATVYNLLVDRAKLFHIRRVCAEKRRSLQNRDGPAVREYHSPSLFLNFVFF